MAKSAGQHNNVALRDVTWPFGVINPDLSRHRRASREMKSALLKMADISRAPTADAPTRPLRCPCPPGRYRLEFQSLEGNGPFKRESHLIEVKTARWNEIYALARSPGRYHSCRAQFCPDGPQPRWLTFNLIRHARGLTLEAAPERAFLEAHDPASDVPGLLPLSRWSTEFPQFEPMGFPDRESLHDFRQTGR